MPDHGPDLVPSVEHAEVMESALMFCTMSNSLALKQTGTVTFAATADGVGAGRVGVAIGHSGAVSGDRAP